MRLLERSDDGDYRLTEFIGDSIPRYAILSHTWGPDHEEVTFEDLKEGRKTKVGYKKIQFCGDQAAKDGIRYCWVDTCCIDKSSSAELSEAINSMFAWYLNAARCYVYLSDVSAREFTSGMLQHSRWFTRGWTLQELVAPASVDFFSVEGERLGDKYSMMQELHHITGISTEVLQGSPLHQLSVEERMSWIAQRTTKREEDAAYSLLGIFDVQMPLLYGEGRKKAFTRLKKEINEQSFTERKREPFSTIPFAPDPDFVDRSEILAWVQDKCARPGARVALVGLGGVGKSQLAIQYAHSVRDATPPKFVFWVYAATRAQFEEAYRGLADRLELPGRQDAKADVLRLVSDWLRDESNGSWAMVLDNVDHVDIFYPSLKGERNELGDCPTTSLSTYLPQSPNGSILITSRNKDAAARLTGGYNNIREVFAMNEDQGLHLLRNKLQDASNQEGAAELVSALDYMPLAISQAAAYINRRVRMTITIYLNEFHASSKKKESLLNWETGDLRRDESASNSVVTTWQLSFERIRQERPSAADLLSLMSLFSSQSIPEPVLRRYRRSMAGADNFDDADDSFEKDLDLLQAYCLVAATAGTDTCEMHALVQFCTRVWLSSFGDPKWWDGEFAEIMAREFPTGEYENWPQCQHLLPHVEGLFEREPETDKAVLAWAQVLTKTAWYMWDRGNYEVGRKVAMKALTVRERILGRDHDLTLTTLNILALVLQAQGRYSEAEELHRRALKVRETELGRDHEITLMNVNNLAGVLQNQGKYDKAEEFYRRAIEGRTKVFGGQHTTTLTSMSNLAAVLQSQGKFDVAETLNRQVLAGRMKLGEQHPYTLTSACNLAGVLQNQKKYEEAERLSRWALEGRMKELGELHPSTLTSLNNQAILLAELKRYEEAAETFQKAYDGLEKTFGPQHPWTIVCRNHFSAMQRSVTVKEPTRAATSVSSRIMRRLLDKFKAQ